MSNSPTIALVTGATCGISLETVRQLARTGAIVFLAGRDPERTRVAARSLSAAAASRNAAPVPFHLEGQPVRSCVLAVGSVVHKQVTTIEAIATTPIGRAIQKAWLDVDVVQCGYCKSDQIMSAESGEMIKPILWLNP